MDLAALGFICKTWGLICDEDETAFLGILQGFYLCITKVSLLFTVVIPLVHFTCAFQQLFSISLGTSFIHHTLFNHSHNSILLEQLPAKVCILYCCLNYLTCINHCSLET